MTIASYDKYELQIATGKRVRKAHTFPTFPCTNESKTSPIHHRVERDTVIQK